MKKIMSILLASLMIISAIGCGNADNNGVSEPADNNGVNEPADNNGVDEPAENKEETKEIRYSFYSGGYTDGGIAAGGFLDAGKLEFSGQYKKVAKEDASSRKENKAVKFDGNSYTLTYGSTYKRPALNGTGKDTHEYYDRYTCKTANGNVVAKIYHTGELMDIMIVGKRAQEDSPTVSLDEEKMIATAERELRQWYGEDVLDKYEFDRVVINGDNKNSVRYKRKIHGYYANTFLSVGFFDDGGVDSIISYEHFDFEVLENEITGEMIQKAEIALRSRIPESRTIQEDTIAVSLDYNTGTFYLGCYAYRNTPVIDSETGNESYVGEKFYVNIN